MTQKSIGPDFSAALQAAELLGLPFSWDANGNFSFDPSMTSAQISAVEACYATYMPNSLAYAQSQQCAQIDAAYYAAIQQSVTFKTAGGVTQTFEADTDSQQIVMQATQGYAIAGTTPTGFYWVAADNTHVPFVLADLQGLYQVILTQGWAAFQKRQNLKGQINAASTVAAVQAIAWS